MTTSVVANQVRIQTESGANQESDNTGAVMLGMDVSGPVSVMSRACCLDPVSAYFCVLFLSSNQDETVLGTCSSWIVLCASCESGTMLMVFSGTGVVATIFATVLGCTEVGLRVLSSRGGAVEENHPKLEQSSSPGWMCPELLPVPPQVIFPPSAISTA